MIQSKMFNQIQRGNRAASGKLEQKARHKPSKSFVFIQKKQRPLAERNPMMEPKILNEDTMTEMEVEETIASSCKRREEGPLLRLEDFGVDQANKKSPLTPTNNYCVVAPLTQNYLKYCQNFKPKKPKSRKIAQKENKRTATGKIQEHHPNIERRDRELTLGAEDLNKAPASQYEGARVRQSIQHSNLKSQLRGGDEGQASFKCVAESRVQRSRDQDLRKKSVQVTQDQSTFKQREPLLPTKDHIIGKAKNSVQFQRSSQKKQNLSQSVDENNPSKKASNFEHVLREILNSKNQVQDEKAVPLFDSTKNQESTKYKESGNVASIANNQSDGLVLPLNHISSIGEQKSNDEPRNDPMNKESTIKQLCMPETRQSNVTDNAQTLNVQNQSSMETGPENSALNQTVVTVGTKNQYQSHAVGEHSVCSNSMYIAPSAGDQGALGMERNKSRRLSVHQGAQTSQSPLMKGQRHLNHLSRVFLFEQEKKKKLEAAKALKERSEMEEVTFQPALVARKKGSEGRVGRSAGGSLANPRGNGSRNAIFMKSQNLDAKSINSKITKQEQENSNVVQSEGIVVGMQNLGSQVNSQNNGKVAQQKPVAQSTQFQKQVFNRLFQDSQKLQTKQEERRKKHYEETIGSYFKPQINCSIQAVTKSVRGRQRQSLDIQNKSMKFDYNSNGGAPTSNAGENMAKDYKSNDSNARHFQGRSKSQANVVGLEDLLKLPRSWHRQDKAWTNGLMSPKDNLRKNLDGKNKNSMSQLNKQGMQRKAAKSVRSNSEINEVPGCQVELSQMDTAQNNNNLASSRNPASIAWLLNKRSVFDLLSQDAARRQRKWRQLSQENRGKCGSRQRCQKRDMSVKTRFKVGEESKAILKSRMVKELDQEVATFANRYGVRLHSPINDSNNRTDDNQEQAATDRGEEQLTLAQFKELLREIHVLQKSIEDGREAQLHESQDIKNILKLMSPIGSKKPILTCRNIQAVIYAILSIHKDWMSEQDALEQRHSQEDMCVYKRKIWKYKMMINKLQSDGSEALAQSSKQELDLLENVSREQILQLNESERQLYILRHTELKEPTGAIFRGRSLCMDEQAVRKVSKVFDRLKQCFFEFIVSRIKKNKLLKEKRMFKKMCESQTDLVFNSAFKSRTREQAEKCEMLRQNFLEMSKKKEQQASSHKKNKYSGHKTIRFIIQNASQDKLKTGGDQRANATEDLQMGPLSLGAAQSVSPRPTFCHNTAVQQADKQATVGQSLQGALPLTKDFLSPPSPSSSSLNAALNRLGSPTGISHKLQQVVDQCRSGTLPFQNSKLRRDGCLRVSGDAEKQSLRAGAVAASVDNFLSIAADDYDGPQSATRQPLKSGKQTAKVGGSATTSVQKQTEKGTYQQLIDQKTKAAEQKRKRAGLSKYISKAKTRPTYMDQYNTHKQRRKEEGKQVEPLVPRSRSRSKYDCYAQQNLVKISKQARDSASSSLHTRKDSASSALHKSYGAMTTLKTSLLKNSTRRGSTKLAKSFALKKTPRHITETTEPAEQETKQSERAGLADDHKTSKAKEHHLKSPKGSSTIHHVKHGEPEEKPGETSQNLSMTLEAGPTHNNGTGCEDIQQIVNQTMGGLTTKKLIERQMQQMFGIGVDSAAR